MQCPHCQHENRDGLKFCNQCGTPLSALCKQCGFRNEPGSKFCGECGVLLAPHASGAGVVQDLQQEVESETAQRETSSSRPEPRPRDLPAPEAEHRQLTVMFCDLVNSTVLSTQLDPETYREVVRAYQTACAEAIERFDGYIAQYLGDGVLVYFGYPQAHEDDAARAVRAALASLSAIASVNTRLVHDHGLQLALRMGIHTGPVVVGEIGGGARQEHLAMGETPNVAARLQGLAEPDHIVMSESTYRLVQGYFECETLGQQTLKGIPESMAIFKVVRESSVQDRLEVAPILPPLVGRDQEMGLLVERWEQAKSGHGQVTLLSGEAGIGKSRLVQVLKDHVAEGPHIRLECRSSPYFTNSALYPIIDMVQRTLRFQADDTPETKLEKLEQNLSQYRLPLEETVLLFGTLLSLPVPEERYPPLNVTPQRQRQKTLEAIVAITLALAERQPLLFILDDAHWTDPTTLEFIDLLLDQTPTASLLILITYRPEFQPTWGNRSYLSQLTLNRLSREGIEQMAAQVAGGNSLPGEVLQQLVEKTDGVPLFVEEMTKAVLESGHLKETDGHYELTGLIGSLTIPATLQDSLMARLDRLVTAKAVAQYASVIGRQFSYELLQAVSQLHETTLQQELGRLVDAELVYQRGVIPAATYIFKHALVQDTAYESLLRSTRQGYHRHIAEVLEERFPETAETQPELLAHHYTEAGLSDQAISYWYQAGQRAMERSAHEEAIAHLKKGLEVLMTLPETHTRAHHELALQRSLGISLSAMQGYASSESARAYTRSRELCRQLGETSQLVSVLSGLRDLHLVRAELNTARELAEELLSLAEGMQESSVLGLAHQRQGHTLFHLGEFVASLTHLKTGVQLFTPKSPRNQLHLQSNQLDPLMFCRSWLARVLWVLGYPDQGLQQSNEALNLARESSYPFNLMTALHFEATFHFWYRDRDTSTRLWEESLEIATQHGFAQILATGTFRRGIQLIVQGKQEEGQSLVRQGLEAYRATGAAVRQPGYFAELGEVYVDTEQPEEGLLVVAEALATVELTGERWCEADLYRLKGELLLKLSSPDVQQATISFHHGCSIARRQQAKSLELRTATSLARLWQSQGKCQEAYDLIAPVYNWFTEGFDTADLKEAQALLAELRT